MKARCVAALACLVGLPLLCGADWLQFRGNDSHNAAADQQLPISWTVRPAEGAAQENVAWQANLPGRGVSSPIVVDGRVLVTAASGYKQDRLHVLCFSAESGEPLWERTFWATGRTLCHPTSSVAANTPASDGEFVYAFYSSNDLVCLDLDGNLQWYRGLTFDYPTAANDVGMASSPVIAGNAVVVQVENKTDSFATGLDRQTGETLWRIERDAQMNWASPAVIPGASPADDIVLLQSTTRLTAHAANTGEQLWSYERGCAGIPSVAAAEDVVFLPSEGLTALRARRDSLAPELLWQSTELEPGSASPVYHDGRLYCVNRAGALTCGDATNGEVLWRSRVQGPFWASPVLAGGHLYFFNQDGHAQVVSLEKEGEIVAENDFGESILGSPAVADGALYVRSDGHLWKIADTSGQN